MTTFAPDSLALTPGAVEQALRAAAARATLAPSIHNTQPWRFVVGTAGTAGTARLELYADSSRRVPAIDATGRQLAISCGAALFGARAALAAAGLDAVTTLLPNRSEPDLLASITIAGRTGAVADAGRRLDQAADTRHSNRRRFRPGLIPDGVLDPITHAAEVEGAWLHQVRELDDRVAVATLTQRAEALQEADPAYRAELRDWTSDAPGRTDGIPSSAIPHVTGAAHDDVPIRDFDTHGAGQLPVETQSSLDQSLLVLGTASDSRRDWLRAGQALGRTLLELTSAGYVASIFSQVAEIPATREQLRHDLRLTGQPHLILRAGVAEPTPATPRRPLGDVIT
jgi:hypothetical protein